MSLRRMNSRGIRTIRKMRGLRRINSREIGSLIRKMMSLRSITKKYIEK